MVRGGLKIEVEAESDRAQGLGLRDTRDTTLPSGAIDLLDHNLVLTHATATTR